MPTYTQFKTSLLILLLVGGLAVVVPLLFRASEANASLSQTVLECNTAKKESRFSCYRAALERRFGGNSDEFIEFLANDAARFEQNLKMDAQFSYAIFGTNCHTFYHAVGDFVATHLDGLGLEALIGLEPQRCTSGYLMGLYKRLALSRGIDTDLLKQFWQLCPQSSQNQCAHEIGHLLHDKHTYSILQILDTISREEYSLTYPRSYDYSIMGETDIDAPFEECEEVIDGDKVAQCYTGIGHNLFLFSEFAPNGYQASFDSCETGTENKDNCYAFLLFRIGINEAAPRFLSRDAVAGQKVCSEAAAQAGRPDLEFHCHLGVGGGIGLYADSAYPVAMITDANAAAISRDLLSMSDLCKSSPAQFIEKCLAGLWGTKFSKLYYLLKLYDPAIEELKPTLDSDFEVVG